MMKVSTLLSAAQWAQHTFGSVHVGDQRRTKRAVAMATAMAGSPAASLPMQMASEADLHAAYRFLQTPDISYEQLIQPHVQQTRAEARQTERVLLIQDTTEVDYQQHPTTTGLGPIGNGSHHGFFLQSVLAVRPEDRQVLGLAHQEPFLRQPVPKGESKRERQQRPRESQVWERSVQAIGVPPSGVQWIHVGDRYSDMFPFLSLCREMQCDFVVRAAQDRCVDVRIEQADAPLPKRSHHRRGEQPNVKPTAGHLFDVVETWAAMGEQDLNLPASKQRKARVAHVKLSYGSLRLWPPETAASADLRPITSLGNKENCRACKQAHNQNETKYFRILHGDSILLRDLRPALFPQSTSKYSRSPLPG